MSETFDCVIVGGGPGGLTAAIYAIRAGLKTVIVEKLGVGGQIALSDIIENYPGFPSLSGGELMKHFEEHAVGLGAEIRYTDVTAIVADGDRRIVKTSSGDLAAKAVIVTTGAEPKKLGFAGETEFTGRGVSTCATCDGPFYKKKPVAVIGGGDTAVKEAIYLSKLCSEVHVVHRRDRFRAEKVLQERIGARENVTVHWSHQPVEVLGDDAGVTGLRIKNVDGGAVTDLSVWGVFVFVGIRPNTGFVECEKDGQGFIVTDENMMTSLPGVFAAGDCRVTPLRQVATAVGDAAIAAVKAEEYVSELEGRAYEGAK
ncbi:MAG: thioredoxin-disulfide reductase [Nitrospinae bacterium]|nr:thioredoxin-disulfide reductase [Nitrospinota bacterium]